MQPVHPDRARQGSREVAEGARARSGRLPRSESSASCRVTGRAARPTRGRLEPARECRRRHRDSVDVPGGAQPVARLARPEHAAVRRPARCRRSSAAAAFAEYTPSSRGPGARIGAAPRSLCGVVRAVAGAELAAVDRRARRPARAAPIAAARAAERSTRASVRAREARAIRTPRRDRPRRHPHAVDDRHRPAPHARARARARTRRAARPSCTCCRPRARSGAAAAPRARRSARRARTPRTSRRTCRSASRRRAASHRIALATRDPREPANGTSTTRRSRIDRTARSRRARRSSRSPTRSTGCGNTIAPASSPAGARVQDRRDRVVRAVRADRPDPARAAGARVAEPRLERPDLVAAVVGCWRRPRA